MKFKTAFVLVLFCSSALVAQSGRRSGTQQTQVPPQQIPTPPERPAAEPTPNVSPVAGVQEGDEFFPYLYLTDGTSSIRDEADGAKKIAKFTKIIDRGQKDVALAYNNRAVVYADLGKYDLAVADLEKARSSHENDVVVFNNQGYLYFKMGRLDDAMTMFNKALAIDADNPTTLGNRANLYQLRGQLNEALADRTRDRPRGQDGTALQQQRNALHGSW
jgi:tetratricopeptide (TPR) repeat protein